MSTPRPSTPSRPTAGFLYLAVVLDVFSRRVVGWAMATHLRTALVTGALEMAVKQRRPAAVIRHSDQGCQYTSPAFGARCQEWGVTPSTGSVGDCFDNAMAESFFATLECELLDRTKWATHAEARSAVFAFIEGWYNTRRHHSALGYYLSPLDFERLRETAPADGDQPRRGARTRGPGRVRRAGVQRQLLWPLGDNYFGRFKINMDRRSIQVPVDRVGGACTVQSGEGKRAVPAEQAGPTAPPTPAGRRRFTARADPDAAVGRAVPEPPNGAPPACRGRPGRSRPGRAARPITAV